MAIDKFLVIICCLIGIFAMLPSIEAGLHHTITRTMSDGTVLCESYESTKDGQTLVIFEKCDPQNERQTKWMWIALNSGELNPGMNCIEQSSGSLLCVGIGKDGKGHLLQQNDQDKSQVWAKSEEDGQFRNGETGSSKCGEAVYADDKSKAYLMMVDCKIGKDIQPTGLITHDN